MPVEVNCPGCQGKFRVPDAALGKRIKCPKCKGVIAVPAGTQPTVASAPIPTLAPKIATQTVTAPVETWTLKTEDGADYGPVSRVELNQWFAEGRITADCQLLKTGAPQWQWATDVFPALQAQESPVANSALQPMQNDIFSGLGSASSGLPSFDAALPTLAANPYAAPQMPTATSMSHQTKRIGKRNPKSWMITAVANWNFVYAGFGVVAPFLAVLLSGRFMDMLALVLAIGIVGCILSPFIVLYGITGYGLTKRRKWGRVMGFITGSLGLLGVAASIAAIFTRGSIYPIIPMLIHGSFAIFTFMTLIDRENGQEFV
jgi:predicted Zn finger-like uncharacterized protein